MKNLMTGVALLVCGFGGEVVCAESYVVALRELDFVDEGVDLEKLLEGERGYGQWDLRREPNMCARTPDGVMVYIAPRSDTGRREKRGDSMVVVEMGEDRVFSGVVDIDHGYKPGVSSFEFSFDPERYEVGKKEEVERVKKTHYHLLARSGYLGAPLFNEMAGGVKFGRDVVRVRNVRDDFSFYSGGRAISDNLALDRELRLMRDDVDAKVDVGTLEGIKTKAIDWKDLMPEVDVEIDGLAMLVPEDQHVLICPSLAEMEKIVAMVEKEGASLFQGFTVRNPFRTLPSRYKVQLGLNFPTAFAKLAPVKSVAVTGYDPFFPTGTDVAVLLESDNPGLLFKMLDGLNKSQDKELALVGDVVVVANSKAQLDRIREVHAGKVASLGSLDEYKFFRHRYPVAEKRSGFVFLSDGCIRRWGGPRMRIAASRRTKSVAALSGLTARSISEGKVGELSMDQEFLLGEVSVKDGVVVSEKMGSLHFMTPSIEMVMDKVTKTEADAYAEWKRGYEDGWSKVFDPIGFSFDLDEKTKELDLTVMPLTVNNEYDDFIELVGKAVLSREARFAEDEHVITASLAIDKEGETLFGVNRSLSGLMQDLKVEPLSWLGSSVTVFAEKDESWRKFGSDEWSFDEHFMKAPIGLRVEHTSQIKLAAFLLAVKSTVAQAAPDAVKWDTRKHGEVTYAVVSSEEDLGLDDEVKLYYVITKNTLTFTLREDVIKREIDRQKLERKLALTPIQESADHFYLKASGQMLMALSSVDGASFSERRREQSYRAIAVLNEWKRRFDAADPVGAHFTKFGEDVFCPGGKGYVWNAEGMTMESVVYGYPAKPKKVEDDGLLMGLFGEVESSMKFENDGLRVRLKVSGATDE
ncbi:MAG: hypothetical protein ACSHX6_02690 [Akkermansiaceae bacterium]